MNSRNAPGAADTRQPSLFTAFWGAAIIAAAASIILIGYLWISNEYARFNQEAQEVRERFLREKQDLARDEVEKVISSIDYHRSTTEERLRASLRERVDEALAIAIHLHDQYQNTRSHNEIEDIVKEALRPIRFNNSRGYFFAVDMQGVEQLYPVAPQLENRNLLDLQDEKGNYVIRDEIEVIKQKGEGFVRDYWRKPEDPGGMVYPKITFVKYFEPFDWYIGTGEYLDDFEQDMKRQLINRIANIRFGQDGYIFLTKYNGDAIIHNREIMTNHVNLWNLEDPNGVKLIQEMRRAVTSPEGAFIYYAWDKPSTAEPAPKTSFVKGIPEWQWMIGAGVYLDEIEELIAGKRLSLKNDMREQIFKIIFTLAALGIFVAALARIQYQRTRRGIRNFLRFFERAATESTSIDPAEVNYSEFATLARAANTMLEDRRRIADERNILSERLQRSRKMEALGLLTGGVAHDLNNILSGVVSGPELILMNPDLPESTRRTLTIVRDCGLRAAAVVEDLLEASRGGQSYSVVLDINETVGLYMASAEHRNLADRRPQVQFKTDLASPLPSISCSKSHLHKTLMNLILNAAEAMVDGTGTVVIATESRKVTETIRGFEDIPPGNFVILRVADDGSGIETNDLSRVFEPFFTKKILGRSGTGLGLSVVWHTMHDHGGYIDVRSSDSGTTFELYFPACSGVPEADHDATPISEYTGAGETVLIVDDEDHQRVIAGEILTRLGYQPETAASGEKAVAWLKDHNADLLLLDMILGSGMNGYETYKAILESKPGQRALIVSGYSKTADVRKAIELGAGGLISKPYTMEEIGIAIAKELRPR